ncbi:hypothetical protein GJU43_14850 [Flavobacterium sp. LC2016-23]|uniref:hypothetical protein n=1 Tax=Flavobacterium sp. LC2016-23 TaxID=2666330 RepID=UPI0012AF0E37|nr:hypothetical protein [Flavobacterium sp. LC2016-23]MRX40565.1 hypothetical protein [Flavobacterium sp. LC2016-23]
MDHAGFENLIAALGDGDKNTAGEVRSLLRHMLQSIFLPGDVKIVICSEEEISADYTATGLGRGKRAGWAICNGLNGTEPFGGRVPLGYSDDYPVIGDTGGSKDAVLVEHSHNTWGFGAPNTGSNGLDSGNYLWGQIASTTTVGVSGVNKNLQPYLVVLYIQKL